MIAPFRNSMKVLKGVLTRAKSTSSSSSGSDGSKKNKSSNSSSSSGSSGSSGSSTPPPPPMPSAANVNTTAIASAVQNGEGMDGINHSGPGVESSMDMQYHNTTTNPMRHSPTLATSIAPTQALTATQLQFAGSGHMDSGLGNMAQYSEPASSNGYTTSPLGHDLSQQESTRPPCIVIMNSDQYQGGYHIGSPTSPSTRSVGDKEIPKSGPLNRMKNSPKDAIPISKTPRRQRSSRFHVTEM
ncbi:hypothetical protein BGW38_006399, partial [Lunasporangiospora selenospora]